MQLYYVFFSNLNENVKGDKMKKLTSLPGKYTAVPDDPASVIGFTSRASPNRY